MVAWAAWLALIATSCGLSKSEGEPQQPAGAGAPGAGTAAAGMSAAGTSSPTLCKTGVSPSCGNGIGDSEFEECDDGNTLGGDGCSPTCRVEVGWECQPTGACTLTGACGNGDVSRIEACDDGNAVSGDGCSADCSQVEGGWACPAGGRACRPLCGDGKVLGDEECDDGNQVNGDGCSSLCRFECVAVPVGTDAFCPSACGDGSTEGAEECDFGAAANDGSYGGCTADCRFADFCGDGIVNGPEACDDASNQVPYVEAFEGGSVCAPGCHMPGFCGDGLVDARYGEECDDGDRNGTADSHCQRGCLLRGTR